MVEMDGFLSSDSIAVLASTNRVDILDKALLRSGRFDRHIAVDLPDKKGRTEIATIYLRRVKLAGDRSAVAQKIAAMTPGLSGADISNLVNEAALLAVRRGAKEVALRDILDASDRILCGLKKESQLLTAKERRRVAVHEAGHALIGWLSPLAEPCVKVTIVPRASGALGFTQSVPKEIGLYSAEELRATLRMTMGGRAAETTLLGGATSGSRDDLRKATAVADAMVREYGFSPLLGPVSLPHEEGETASPETEREVEKERKRLLEQALKEAETMVRENRDKLETLAGMLLEKETITNVELEQVLGKREGVNPEGYKAMEESCVCWRVIAWEGS